MDMKRAVTDGNWMSRTVPLLRVERDATSCHSCQQVREYAWGDDVASLPEAPDLITGADIVYQQEHFASLLDTLECLAAPHTLIYLAFRLRGALSMRTY